MNFESKFELLKKRIDSYITERVDRIFKQRLQSAIEEMLFPMAQAFIEETLNNRLEEMLRQGVEGALEDLASEFDLDFEPDSQPEETEDEEDVVRTEKGKRLEASFNEGIETARQTQPPAKVGVSPEAIKLMAFIQFYQEKHGPETWPLPNRVFKHLRFSSVDLSKLYTELSEEGWIKRSRSTGGIKSKILRPLPNPSAYLGNPF